MSRRLSLQWHVFGCLLSVMICLAIWHVYCRGAFNITASHLPYVAPHEAAKVLNQAEYWNEALAQATQIHRQQIEQIETLATWLPTEVSFEELTNRLHESATTFNVNLLSVDQGNQIAGARVGVITCTAIIQGSFAAICEWMESLSGESQPLWCDAIHLSPHNGGTNAANACEATITLRAPQSSGGTLSERLTALRAIDGH